MKKTSTYRVSTYKICIVAFAICINLVGGQIALFLKLPIYLDSIGTVFIASTLGPIYGMLPNVISGLFMGMTVDVYSLYLSVSFLVWRQVWYIRNISRKNGGYLWQRW